MILNYLNWCHTLNKFVWLSLTCDTLVATEDTLEPISRLLSADVKEVAAETVPNKGNPGILRIGIFDKMLVSLSFSFEYRFCSESLPKYQPPKPTLLRVVRLNATCFIPFMFSLYFVIVVVVVVVFAKPSF